MNSLANKRYIFRRRPIRGRVALAVIASAAGLWALNLHAAETKPGGYLRFIGLEAPTP